MKNKVIIAYLFLLASNIFYIKPEPSESSKKLLELVQKKLMTTDEQIQTKELIDSEGIDINAADAEGCTLLHYAIMNKYNELAKKLLAKKAFVDSQTSDGFTPLFIAIAGTNAEMAELLIQNGANVNAKENLYGESTLHFAAKKGLTNMADILIKANAIIDIKDKRGNTPLIDAIENKQIEMVKQLIQNKADININGYYNNTPLHYATNIGSADLVNILIKNGANINAQDNSLNTPLHIAALYGYVDLVNILIENGANINAKDCWEDTPLQLAKSHQHIDVIELFIKQNSNISFRDIWAARGWKNKIKLLKVKFW